MHVLVGGDTVRGRHYIVSCAGIPATRLLGFGRPRVWEPMFSTSQSLVNVSIRNQVNLLSINSTELNYFPFTVLEYWSTIMVAN